MKADREEGEVVGNSVEMSLQRRETMCTWVQVQGAAGIHAQHTWGVCKAHWGPHPHTHTGVLPIAHIPRQLTEKATFHWRIAI